MLVAVGQSRLVRRAKRLLRKGRDHPETSPRLLRRVRARRAVRKGTPSRIGLRGQLVQDGPHSKRRFFACSSWKAHGRLRSSLTRDDLGGYLLRPISICAKASRVPNFLGPPGGSLLCIRCGRPAPVGAWKVGATGLLGSAFCRRSEGAVGAGVRWGAGDSLVLEVARHVLPLEKTDGRLPARTATKSDAGMAILACSRRPDLDSA